jgi:hypothetical protein
VECLTTYLGEEARRRFMKYNQNISICLTVFAEGMLSPIEDYPHAKSH